MFNAKNLLIDIESAKIPCAVFGKGSKNLIILPGLGDGLATVKGKALPLAIAYSAFGKDFTVYMMSRREPLPEGFSTKDMAADMALAMEKLGIEKASVVGVSMGGMIAQHFAADFPEKTEKLVLVATAPKSNETMKECIGEWTKQAQNGKGAELMDSNIRNMYSDEYYRKNRWLAPITGKLTVPKDCTRFIRMADACLSHDAESSLEKITAQTLVIGGSEDRTVGPEGSESLAKAISGAELVMYPGLRHAVYDEAKDFWKRVLEFIKQE